MGTTPHTPPQVIIHRSLPKALRLFDEDRLRWLDEAAALGPLTTLRLGPAKAAVVTDPDLARTILVSDASKWRRPPAAVVSIRLAVGENLFTQPDDIWAALQPQLAPTFRKKALEHRLADFPALVADEVAAIPRNTTLDVELVMGQIALVLAAWVLLGERLDRTRAEEIAFHQKELVGWVGDRLGRLSSASPVTFGRAARTMRKHRRVLDHYADEVIARAQPNDDDVLGALLGAQRDGVVKGSCALRSHVLGMFLAGNETTAAALAWACVNGAANIHAWRGLRSSEAEVNNYLTETLRLTPAVWGFARSPTTKGAVLHSGELALAVPRSQVATVYLRGMNHDPKRWPDPLKFDPARHATSTKDQQRGLLPFGLGPRSCIGQHLAMAEMLAVLPALAKHGDVVVAEPIFADSRFALRVKGGLRGRFVFSDAVPSRDGTQSGDTRREDHRAVAVSGEVDAR